tara:strand:+ start:2559 stop:4358 length:1800 start_codon:yes stop_codon:yes gene_type:complete
MWIVFGLTFLSMILYSIDKIRMEVISLFSIVVLLLIFQNSPILGVSSGGAINISLLLNGFANPALIALMSLLIIGHGLLVTGALEDIAVWLSGDRDKNTKYKFYGVMLLVFILSATLNNTPIIIMFIPIIIALSRQMSVSSRSILIPLSYVSILGGMTTLIGSSTNLLVSGTTSTLIGRELNFFEFTGQGIILATVGFLYAIIILPKLLQRNLKGKTEESKTDFESGRIYLVEISIDNENPLIGKKFVSGILSDIKEIAVNVVLRDGDRLLPPFEDIEIKSGDKLVLEITKNQLTEKIKSNDRIFNSIDSSNFSSERGILIEASITPRSFFIGRNLTQTNFEAETNCKIIGIKNEKKFVRNLPKYQKLEAGHILLIKGEEEDIKNLRGKKEIIPIEWSAIYLPAKQYILRSRLIFIFTILAAATGLLNITVAALLGVILMLLTNVLTIRDALNALDSKIFLLVASSIMLSTALQETGGALFIADSLQNILVNLDAVIVLSLFFITVAVVTNFLSNNATAILFAPIAINLASSLNIQPEPFIYCLIFAANCSFATPIGYQTNLLVMGPGNYQFKDYLTSGIPLVLLIWLSYTIMISFIGF